MRKLAIIALAAVTMVAPIATSANATVICNDTRTNCRKVVQANRPHTQQRRPQQLSTGEKIMIGVGAGLAGFALGKATGFIR